MVETNLTRKKSYAAEKLFCLIFTTVVFLFPACTGKKTETLPPSGLMCELMKRPEKTVITDALPEFSWIVNSDVNDDIQSAYQVIVASSRLKIEHIESDMWDSGKVKTGRSIDVEYNGKPLSPDTSYFWKVRTWNRDNKASHWSETCEFRTGSLKEKTRHVDAGSFENRYPLVKHEIAPVKIVKKAKGYYFVDFGRAAFGTVKLTLTSPADGHTVEVHLGEVPGGDNTIDRNPGGSRRYRMMTLPLREGRHTYTVSITPDERNTGDAAIKMPENTGEVMPFRYCEIKNSPCELDRSMVSQVAVNYPFDDNASHFTSSSTVLNDVWDLCKYSIKATSFCGVYVDGDRERIPYEADAYINQLSHYCVDREYTMARFSHEYLMTHPTWPTEWILHSVLMAWADYLYTGNSESIETYYGDLKAKTLLPLARGDGLISTQTGLVTEDVLRSIHFKGELRDIVDWPPASFGGPGERDGYVLTEINTVVNAFHYRALVLMSKIAAGLKKPEEEAFFSDRAELVKQAFNEKLLDKKRRIYVDGEGSGHSSLHANMFPLAFGLVPDEYKGSVVDFIKTRGMACSVYGAQYLLEGLYNACEDEYALSLLTSTSERSWAHMIYAVGSTITLEAWDNRFKPNQDWNHAWGAAPANIIPRFIMGVRSLEPGFGKILIKPMTGSLKSGSLDFPTVRGTVHVKFTSVKDESFILDIQTPANTHSKVYLPKLGIGNSEVMVDGSPHRGVIEGNFVVLDNIGSGKHRFVRGRVSSTPAVDDEAFERALKNGLLANEGFKRCRNYVTGWLKHADPVTGLIPRNLEKGKDIWNARDSAADNYPFMVLTAAITDRSLFNGRMLDMLRTEIRLTSRIGTLPDTYSFSKRNFRDAEPDIDRIMFGASEYIKDGLLPLTEWLGASPWSERLTGMLDDIWKHAPVETKYGKIVSTSHEINGEMLQALSRIYWMTGDSKYLEWAVRLGDWYLLDKHHPTRDADHLRLRDHGCEIVSGLCELYATVHFAMPEKKEEYSEPVHAMLDRILEVGRNEHGLFYDAVNPQTGSVERERIADTFGYTYNGFYTVYLIDGTESYRDAALKALGSLYDYYRNFDWERGSADGYADAIESALNLYNREPVPSAANWLDSEIQVMWGKQQPDGVIEGWHGDGNFARTTIMYCLWKTNGITIRPWRDDVVFGAVLDGDVLRLSIRAEKEWNGKILFDTRRHKTAMKMPLDWPRINQFPEWYTVESESRYEVRDLATGSKTTYSGTQLKKGITINLKPGIIHQLVLH